MSSRRTSTPIIVTTLLSISLALAAPAHAQCTLAGCTVGQKPSGAAGTMCDCTVTVGNVTRSFKEYVPTHLPASGTISAVVSLHGGGSYPQRMIDAEGGWGGTGGRGIINLADRDKFLAFFPDGGCADVNPGCAATSHHWNDCRSDNPLTKTSLNDVAFLDAVIGRAITHGAHPSRVSVWGFSNGGLMAYRLATESDLMVNPPARIAAVAANLPADSDGPTDPCLSVDSADPIPVLVMNGWSDSIMPYNGGQITAYTGTVWPMGVKTDPYTNPSTIRTWVSAVNDCDASGGWAVANVVTSDNSVGPEIYEYHRNCLVNPSTNMPSEVVLYDIDGGHAVPGFPGSKPSGITDKVNMDISGPAEIWDFFQRPGLKADWQESSVPEYEWGHSYSTAGGSLSVSSEPDGNHGLVVTTANGGEAGVYRTRSNGAAGFHARFWSDVHALTLPSGSSFQIFTATDAANAVGIAWVELRHPSGSGFQVRASARLDSGATASTSWIDIMTTEQPISLRWRGGNDASDSGYVCIGRPDVPPEQCVSSLDNDGQRIFDIGVGISDFSGSGVSGVVGFDEYQDWTW